MLSKRLIKLFCLPKEKINNLNTSPGFMRGVLTIYLGLPADRYKLIRVFTTMLKSPNINADVITPSLGLLLTCREEKYIQYCTIIYSVQYLHAMFSNAKISLLGVVVFSA